MFRVLLMAAAAILWIFISLGAVVVFLNASWGLPLLLGILAWVIISSIVSYYLARLALEQRHRSDGEA